MGEHLEYMAGNGEPNREGGEVGEGELIMVLVALLDFMGIEYAKV